MRQALSVSLEFDVVVVALSSSTNACSAAAVDQCSLYPTTSLPSYSNRCSRSSSVDKHNLVQCIIEGMLL